MASRFCCGVKCFKYVCVFLCVFVCMYVCMSQWQYSWLISWLCSSLYIRACVCVYVCLSVCLSVCMRDTVTARRTVISWLCNSLYIRACLCVYVCLSVCLSVCVTQWQYVGPLFHGSVSQAARPDSAVVQQGRHVSQPSLQKSQDRSDGKTCSGRPAILVAVLL